MRKLLFISVLLLSSHASMAAATDSISLWKERSLTYLEFNPDSALLFLNKGLYESRLQKDRPNEAWFSLQKGRLFLSLGDTQAASGYLEKSFRFFRENPDDENFDYNLLALGIARADTGHLQQALRRFEARENCEGMVSTYLALTHVNSEMDVTKAMRYGRSAYKIARKHADSILIGKSLLSVSNLFWQMEDTAGALAFLKLRSQHPIPLQLRAELDLLEAEILLAISQEQQAVFLLEQLLGNDRVAFKSQAAASTMLAAIYESRDQLSEALRQLKTADSLRTMAAADNKQNLVRLLEEEYNGHLKSEEIDRLNSELKIDFYLKVILVAVILVSLFFALLIFRLQRHRIERKKALLNNHRRQAQAEQRLVASQLQQKKLEEEILSKEIEEKKLDLSNFAAGFVQHKDVLKKLQQEINRIKKTIPDSSRREEIGELNLILMQLSQRDVPRKNLLDKALQIDDELLFQLQQKFPKLTEQDLELMVLLISGVDSEEISAIYNIEKASLMTKRYRLRKKLGMTKGQSFDDFVEKEISLNVSL